MRLRTKLAGAAGAAAIAYAAHAYAAGLFATLPIIGGGPYCAASNVIGPAQQTITTTGGNPAFPVPPELQGSFPGRPPGAVPVVCQSNVPPGPVTFIGTENIPADIYPPGAQIMAGGAQTALVSVTQLGQGAVHAIDMPVTPAGQPIVVPPNTGFLVLDSGADASALVDLPNPAIDGEILTIVCNGGAATSLTVQTSGPTTTPRGPQTQAIAPAQTAAACAMGTVQKYRFVAMMTGSLMGDTWLRIQ